MKANLDESSRTIFYRNITIVGIRLFRFIDLEEVMINMKLFKRDKTIKKWHKKAWMVDPRTTRIVLVPAAAPKRKHVPPWIYRELDNSIQEMYARSNVRMQYAPVGCAVCNVTETSSNINEGTLPF